MQADHPGALGLRGNLTPGRLAAGNAVTVAGALIARAAADPGAGRRNRAAVARRFQSAFQKM